MRQGWNVQDVKSLAVVLAYYTLSADIAYLHDICCILVDAWEGCDIKGSRWGLNREKYIKILVPVFNFLES